MSVTDLYVPNEDGTKDHCYISQSYDATSHFETTTDDVKDIYRRIMGKPLIVKEKLRPTQVNPSLITPSVFLQSPSSYGPVFPCFTAFVGLALCPYVLRPGVLLERC